MGLVVFAVSSLLCALAPSGWVLVAARCLQGVGAAFLVPSSLAMINARFSGAEQAQGDRHLDRLDRNGFRHRPAARRGAGRRAELAVDLRGQHRAAGRHAVPDHQALARRVRGPNGRHRIDVVGAVLNAVGLTGAVYALIEQQRLGFSHPAVLTSLVVGVACLLAFPWWERSSPHPMMPLHIFAARNFAVGNLATVFLYAAVSLGTLLVALFLQETAGMSATAGRPRHAADPGAVVLPGALVRHPGGQARPAALHGARPAGRRGRLSADDERRATRSISGRRCCRAWSCSGSGCR